MASSTTIASVIQSLQASTGAIKAKATQIVAQGRGIQGSEATFQLTGDALANLQDQLNNTRLNAVNLAQIVQSGGTTITIGTDTQVIFNDKLVLTGSKNLTFDYTDGILKVLSVDGTYSVAIGEPSAGIGAIITHLTTGDTVEIAGKTITCLRGGVAGDTIWSLADNGSGVGKLLISNGAGTGGIDGDGAGVYGTGSGLLKTYNFVAVDPTNPANSDEISITSTSIVVTNAVGHNVLTAASLSSGILTEFYTGAGEPAAKLDTTPGYGVISIQNGTGTGGFDSAGGLILGFGSTGQLNAVKFHTEDFSTSNTVTMTGESVIALSNLSLNTWYISGDNSGDAVLALCNGSGTGGFDGLGALVYAVVAGGTYGQLSSGVINAQNLSNSTGIFLNAASSTESTLNVQNSLGSLVFQVETTTTGSILQLTDSAPATFSFKVQLTTGQNPTAASATGGAAGALPSLPATYLQCISVNGTQYKIPLYNL